MFYFPTSKKPTIKPSTTESQSGIIEGPPIREVSSNNLAGIKAFSNYIVLADILQDNNNRLVVIDTSKNLKIFKGTLLQDESKLSIVPAGIIAFYGEEPSSKNIIPLLAVAGGNTIFIYKYLKGFIKYPLPDLIPNSEEMFFYQQLNNGEIDAKTCLTKLQMLADRLLEIKINDDKNEEENEKENEENDKNKKMKENSNLPLSQMTLHLLILKQQEEQIKFLEENKNMKTLLRNYITCITYIHKDNTSDINANSYLVIGTENCTIYIIEYTNKKPLCQIRLPEVPFLIVCQGGYKSDHTILVGDRGCTIYVIKKDSIVNKFIMPQPLVGLVIAPKNFYVGTMSNNYISYNFNGDKVFSIIQPAIISCMEFYYRKSEDLPIVIIALKNKEVRFYNDKNLLIVMKVNDNIFGMKYGKYATTDDCLVLFTYSGSLIVKTFGKENRFSKLKYEEEKKEEGKIVIPKRTPLFLDLAEREKENSFNMQNTFQNDLLRIRYKAMDSYVKMLKIGNAPQNYSSSSTMKIAASLEGLGPNFKLNLILDNSGNEPIINAVLTLDFNRKVYYFDKENIQLGIIMPRIPIKYSLPFKNVSESGSSGMIKIIILDKEKSTPLIQSTIKVPVSELEML